MVHVGPTQPAHAAPVCRAYQHGEAARVDRNLQAGGHVEQLDGACAGILRDVRAHGQRNRQRIHHAATHRHALRRESHHAHTRDLHCKRAADGQGTARHVAHLDQEGAAVAVRCHHVVLLALEHKPGPVVGGKEQLAVTIHHATRGCLVAARGPVTKQHPTRIHHRQHGRIGRRAGLLVRRGDAGHHVERAAAVARRRLARRHVGGHIHHRQARSKRARRIGQRRARRVHGQLLRRIARRHGSLEGIIACCAVGQQARARRHLPGNAKELVGRGHLAAGLHAVLRRHARTRSADTRRVVQPQRRHGAHSDNLLAVLPADDHGAEEQREDTGLRQRLQAHHTGIRAVHTACRGHHGRSCHAVTDGPADAQRGDARAVAPGALALRVPHLHLERVCEAAGGVCGRPKGQHVVARAGEAHCQPIESLVLDAPESGAQCGSLRHGARAAVALAHTAAVEHADKRLAQACACRLQLACRRTQRVGRRGGVGRPRQVVAHAAAAGIVEGRRPAQSLETRAVGSLGVAEHKARLVGDKTNAGDGGRS